MDENIEGSVLRKLVGGARTILRPLDLEAVKNFKRRSDMIRAVF